MLQLQHAVAKLRIDQEEDKQEKLRKLGQRHFMDIFIGRTEDAINPQSVLFRLYIPCTGMHGSTARPQLTSMFNVRRTSGRSNRRRSTSVKAEASAIGCDRSNAEYACST